jgi:hypothetical protein
MLKTIKEIKSWLGKCGIENYTINEDLTVDVEGDVFIGTLFNQVNLNKVVPYLPVQFGTVIGSFALDNVKTKSLKGCPKEVGENLIINSCNYITNLNGCPTEVGGSFTCSNNKKLEFLRGCPKEISENISIVNNAVLSSLRSIQKKVNGNFYCMDNSILLSLTGGPTEVKENCIISNNMLHHLVGSPKYIGGDFDCSSNVLETLKGSPEKINGKFNCSFNSDLKLCIYGPETDNYDYSYTQITKEDIEVYFTAIKKLGFEKGVKFAKAMKKMQTLGDDII